MDNQILRSPIITEKSTKRAKEGYYSFAVSKNSRKRELRKQIEELFKVNVVSIHTATVPGKKKRRGKRQIEVKGQPWKKAIVKLKSEQKIPLFEVGK